MTVCLAVDPGSSESAWIIYDAKTSRPWQFAKESNEGLIEKMRDPGFRALFDFAVIEWTAPRGMPASAELFETMWWAGRFAEAVRSVRVERLPRAVVKKALCGTTASKDANVRQALIDRFGGTGGKAVAIGRKASPGPLYGIAADVWSALAVAVVWGDGRQDA